MKCLICQKSIEHRKAGSGRQRIYCSDKCRYKSPEKLRKCRAYRAANREHRNAKDRKRRRGKPTRYDPVKAKVYQKRHYTKLRLAYAVLKELGIDLKELSNVT